MTVKTKKIIIEGISFLFILLFIYASLSKLLEYRKFRIQLGQSPLLTDIAGWVAWTVPIIEIIISVLIIHPKLRLTGLYASFGLMVLFTAYIVSITQFSNYIPCSCGGVLQKMSWNQHLTFNLFFVLLAFSAIILQIRLPSKQYRN